VYSWFRVVRLHDEYGKLTKNWRLRESALDVERRGEIERKRQREEDGK
jgi:aspartyl/asparaginyl beta-hydroxylase (cupin superfamily)